MIALKSSAASIHLSPHICPSCLRQLRRSNIRSKTASIRAPATAPRRSLFTTSSVQKASEDRPQDLHPLSNSADLSSRRRLLHLSGRDAGHFLQGLTTRNISTSPSSQVKAGGSGQGMYSAFLNAAGRVLYDVFIYPLAGTQTWVQHSNAGASSGVADEEEGFLIEVDAAEVDSLAAHLKRFKLRAKINVRVLGEDEWTVWARWGDTQTASEHQEPSADTIEEDLGSDITTLDHRAPNLGQRIILPSSSSQTPPTWTQRSSPYTSYHTHRILHGVPEGQIEIPSASALPQESNIDYMQGIDFRKGCYVGQELTIRTHHTGVVRKRILPVRLYKWMHHVPETLEPDVSGYWKRYDLEAGTNIVSVVLPGVGKRARSVGRWLGGAGDLGLALCGLEAMSGTVLRGEGGKGNEDGEFVVQGTSGGDEVRVKAFVPGWHHERGNEQRVQR